MSPPASFQTPAILFLTPAALVLTPAAVFLTLPLFLWLWPSHQGGRTRGCSSCSRDLAGRLAQAAGAGAGAPGLRLSPAGRGMTLGKRDQISDHGAVPHLGVQWAWHWSLSHCALIECQLCACTYWVPIVYTH